MRILYGVVGEGMGHATRSRVVIAHLLDQGHQIHVVVSGKAHGFLARAFDDRVAFELTEIRGLRLVQDAEGVDRSETLWANLADAPESLRHNLRVYRDVAARFAADVVISDFESWAYLYARAHEVPVISIDNIQILHRCSHSEQIGGTWSRNYALARYSAKAKMRGAYHYLITTAFLAPVSKGRTTLVPPILRPEVLAAKREPGDHVLVYQHGEALKALLPTLQGLTNHRFRVYGLGARDTAFDHISFCPFSQTGFIDDLRTARGVIAGGGFSLMSECVHLRVPLLSVPIADQFEQELNARYLERLDYGVRANVLSKDVVTRFLGQLSTHAAALQAYTPHDNTMTLACVDELLRRVAMGEPPAETLDSPSLADRVTSRIDAAVPQS